jgi:hypothetical protein
VALLGGAGEVQRLADREEVADLVHLHGAVSTAARDPTMEHPGSMTGPHQFNANPAFPL